MTTGFSRDSSKLSGFDRTFARSLVNYYKNFGTGPERFNNFAENSVNLAMSRDTRDAAVIPTAGSRVSLGGRFTGFGGDVAFNNYFSEAVFYHRVYWKAIFKAKANGALLQEYQNDPIPFDRRLILGGISSIRGYRPGEIGPRDRYGNVMGGDRSLYTNMEVLFPLIKRRSLAESYSSTPATRGMCPMAHGSKMSKPVMALVSDGCPQWGQSALNTVGKWLLKWVKSRALSPLVWDSYSDPSKCGIKLDRLCVRIPATTPVD